MYQSAIVEEMKVQPVIDVEFEIRRRVDFIKNQLLQSSLKTLVLGISGGIDSCACGRLAQIAINELNESGSGYRFIAVRLPYEQQADENDAQNFQSNSFNPVVISRSMYNLELMLFIRRL